MSGESGDPDVLLGRLRQQTRRLVAELPGPLRRVRMRSGESMVEVEWPDSGGADAVAVTAGPAPDTSAPDPTPDGRDIPAPIVGTFYRASEPGAEPFVEVGDLVEAGQVVGIVEAMKLMNQVTAEVSGRVTAVLARNGESVQFGQPLIRLATV